MGEQFFTHVFENGLTLVVESMPAMQSAAMNFLVPAGVAGDPSERLGCALVLSDLVLRGAGKRDAHELTDYLDGLGLRRSAGANIVHTSFRCAALAEKVLQGLDAYADIIRRPLLPQGGFASARDLAIQALAGLDDDPRQKLMVKLREWFLPCPYGRNVMGDAEQLRQLTLEDCREDWRRRYHPDGSILGVAGAVDFHVVRDKVAECFGDWSGEKTVPFELVVPPRCHHHEQQQSEQTHIGIAYPSIARTDPDYYLVLLAMEVLGGGMSGRLFTEVREKRGLCYSVTASYSGNQHFGSIFGYAGTSNDRAQATLDCFLEELHRLSDGVTSAELERARTGLKASLIMQGESTRARSGEIVYDQFIYGRMRSLDEIKSAIDGVTLDAVNDYLKKHPAGPFTIVTVGPDPLKLPDDPQMIGA